MNLEEALRQAQRDIQSGVLTNEAQVKQAVVAPILYALGWNVFDGREFVPEFAVGTESGRGSVDYALCRTAPYRQPLVFIETKKLGSADVAGEEQLFRYAANQGVPFLILTDGDVWNFYLAMAPGAPQARIVYAAELKQQERQDEYLRFFSRYLDKVRVISGEARRDAENDKESQANRLTAQNAIPGCWRALLGEPDDILVTLLTEAVEIQSGIRPEPDDVKAFLIEHSYAPPPRKENTPDNPPERRGSTPPDKTGGGSKVSSIVGFELEGSRRDCRSGIKTIGEILREFQRRDYTFMSRFAPSAIGRNRRLVAENPNEIYDNPNLQGKVFNLGNGWWLATNISTDTIKKSVILACKAANVEFGTQLTLIER